MRAALSLSTEMPACLAARHSQMARDKYVGVAAQVALDNGTVCEFLPPDLREMGLNFAQNASHVFDEASFWRIIALGHDEQIAVSVVAFLSNGWDGRQSLPQRTMQLAITECSLAGVVQLLARLCPQTARVEGAFRMLPLHVALAHSSNAATHAYVLRAHPEAAQSADSMGFLPLHLAARLNRHASVRLLLHAHPAGAGQRTKFGETLAEWRALAMPYTQLTPRLGLTGALPLHLALKGQADARMEDEDADTVAALCSVFPGALLMFDERGNLPVHLAAASQAPEDVVRVLLRCVSEHNMWACLLCHNALGMTALEMAVASGAGRRVVRLWLDATSSAVRALHARVHSTASGKSPCSTGGLVVVTRSTLAADARFRATVHMVQKGAPGSQGPASESTVLVQTATETQKTFEGMISLLSTEAPVVKDLWARTLLRRVVGGEHLPRDGILALLLSAFPGEGMRFCPEGGDLLHTASSHAEHGPALVADLLKLGVLGAKSRNARMELPLHVLAASGASDKAQCFKALLRAHPCAVSAVDVNGQTPLHQAVSPTAIRSNSCGEIMKHLIKTRAPEEPIQTTDARGDSVLGLLMRALVSDDNLDHMTQLEPTAKCAAAEQQCLVLQLVLSAWPRALFAAAHSGLEPLDLIVQAVVRVAQHERRLQTLTRQIAAVVLVVTIELERDSDLARRGAQRCRALQDALIIVLPVQEQEPNWQTLIGNIETLARALDLLAREHDRAEDVRSEILHAEDAGLPDPLARSSRQRARPPRQTPEPIDHKAVERACARARRKNVAQGKQQRARANAGPVVHEMPACPEADVVPIAKPRAPEALEKQIAKPRTPEALEKQIANPHAPEALEQQIAKPRTPEALEKQIARLKERLHAKALLVDEATADNELLRGLNTSLESKAARVDELTGRNEALLALNTSLHERVLALEASMTQQLLLHRYHDSNVLG